MCRSTRTTRESGWRSCWRIPELPGCSRWRRLESRLPRTAARVICLDADLGGDRAREHRGPGRRHRTRGTRLCHPLLGFHGHPQGGGRAAPGGGTPGRWLRLRAARSRRPGRASLERRLRRRDVRNLGRSRERRHARPRRPRCHALAASLRGRDPPTEDHRSSPHHRSLLPDLSRGARRLRHRPRPARRRRGDRPRAMVRQVLAEALRSGSSMSTARRRTPPSPRGTPCARCPIPRRPCPSAAPSPIPGSTSSTAISSRCRRASWESWRWPARGWRWNISGGPS